MQVRAGSTMSTSGGTLASVEDAKFHPHYTTEPRLADIALLKLASPLLISDTISVLFIPPQDITLPDDYPVEVVGWGFETGAGPQLDYLKLIMLSTVNHEVCRRQHAEYHFEVAEEGTVCGPAAAGACAGDWGAPMVLGGVAVGVLSHYHACGHARYADVFTRVDTYSDWILEEAAGA